MLRGKTSPPSLVASERRGTSPLILVAMLALLLGAAKGQLMCETNNELDSDNDTEVLSLSDCTNVSLTIVNTTSLTVSVYNTTMGRVFLSGNTNLTLMLTGVTANVQTGSFLELQGNETNLTLTVAESFVTVSSGVALNASRTAATASTLGNAVLFFLNNQFVVSGGDAFMFNGVTQGSNITMSNCSIVNNRTLTATTVATGLQAVSVSGASSFTLSGGTSMVVGTIVAIASTVSIYGLYFPSWAGGGSLTVDGSTIVVAPQVLTTSYITISRYAMFGSWQGVSVTVKQSTLRALLSFLYNNYCCPNIYPYARFIGGSATASSIAATSNVMEVTLTPRNSVYYYSNVFIFAVDCSTSNVTFTANVLTYSQTSGSNPQIVLFSASFNGGGTLLIKENTMYTQANNAPQVSFFGGSVTSQVVSPLNVSIVNNTVNALVGGISFTQFASAMYLSAAAAQIVVAYNVYTNQAAFASTQQCSDLIGTLQGSQIVLCGNRLYCADYTSVLVVGTGAELKGTDAIRDNLANYTTQSSSVQLTWSAAYMNGGVVRNNTFIASGVTTVHYYPFSPRVSGTSRQCVISGNVINAFNTAAPPAAMVTYQGWCSTGVHICNNTATIALSTTLRFYSLNSVDIGSYGNITFTENYGSFYGVPTMTAVWLYGCDTYAYGVMILSSNYLKAVLIPALTVIVTRAVTIRDGTYFLVTRNHIDAINATSLTTYFAGFLVASGNMTVRNNQVLAYQSSTVGPPTLDSSVSCVLDNAAGSLQCNNTVIAIGLTSHSQIWCSSCGANGAGSYFLMYNNQVYDAGIPSVDVTLMVSSHSNGGTTAIFNNEAWLVSTKTLSSVSMTLLSDSGMYANTMIVSKNYFNVYPDASPPSDLLTSMAQEPCMTAVNSTLSVVCNNSFLVSTPSVSSVGVTVGSELNPYYSGAILDVMQNYFVVASPTLTQLAVTWCYLCDAQSSAILRMQSNVVLGQNVTSVSHQLFSMNAYNGASHVVNNTAYSGGSSDVNCTSSLASLVTDVQCPSLPSAGAVYCNNTALSCNTASSQYTLLTRAYPQSSGYMLNVINNTFATRRVASITVTTFQSVRTYSCLLCNLSLNTAAILDATTVNAKIGTSFNLYAWTTFRHNHLIMHNSAVPPVANCSSVSSSPSNGEAIVCANTIAITSTNNTFMMSSVSFTVLDNPYFYSVSAAPSFSSNWCSFSRVTNAIFVGASQLYNNAYMTALLVQDFTVLATAELVSSVRVTICSGCYASSTSNSISVRGHTIRVSNSSATTSNIVLCLGCSSQSLGASIAIVSNEVSIMRTPLTAFGCDGCSTSNGGSAIFDVSNNTFSAQSTSASVTLCRSCTASSNTAMTLRVVNNTVSLNTTTGAATVALLNSASVSASYDVFVATSLLLSSNTVTLNSTASQTSLYMCQSCTAFTLAGQSLTSTINIAKLVSSTTAVVSLFGQGVWNANGNTFSFEGAATSTSFIAYSNPVGFVNDSQFTFANNSVSWSRCGGSNTLTVVQANSLSPAGTMISVTGNTFRGASLGTVSLTLVSAGGANLPSNVTTLSSNVVTMINASRLNVTGAYFSTLQAPCEVRMVGNSFFTRNVTTEATTLLQVTTALSGAVLSVTGNAVQSFVTSTLSSVTSVLLNVNKSFWNSTLVFASNSMLAYDDGLQSGSAGTVAMTAVAVANWTTDENFATLVPQPTLTTMLCNSTMLSRCQLTLLSLVAGSLPNVTVGANTLVSRGALNTVVRALDLRAAGMVSGIVRMTDVTLNVSAVTSALVFGVYVVNPGGSVAAVANVLVLEAPTMSGALARASQVNSSSKVAQHIIIENSDSGTSLVTADREALYGSDVFVAWNQVLGTASSGLNGFALASVSELTNGSTVNVSSNSYTCGASLVALSGDGLSVVAQQNTAPSAAIAVNSTSGNVTVVVSGGQLGSVLATGSGGAVAVSVSSAGLQLVALNGTLTPSSGGAPTNVTVQQSSFASSGLPSVLLRNGTFANVTVSVSGSSFSSSQSVFGLSGATATGCGLTAMTATGSVSGALVDVRDVVGTWNDTTVVMNQSTLSAWGGLLNIASPSGGAVSTFMCHLYNSTLSGVNGSAVAVSGTLSMSSSSVYLSGAAVTALSGTSGLTFGTVGSGVSLSTTEILLDNTTVKGYSSVFSSSSPLQRSQLEIGSACATWNVSTAPLLKSLLASYFSNYVSLCSSMYLNSSCLCTSHTAAMSPTETWTSSMSKSFSPAISSSLETLSVSSHSFSGSVTPTREITSTSSASSKPSRSTSRSGSMMLSASAESVTLSGSVSKEITSSTTRTGTSSGTLTRSPSRPTPSLSVTHELSISRTLTATRSASEMITASKSTTVSLTGSPSTSTSLSMGSRTKSVTSSPSPSLSATKASFTVALSHSVSLSGSQSQPHVSRSLTDSGEYSASSTSSMSPSPSNSITLPRTGSKTRSVSRHTVTDDDSSTKSPSLEQTRSPSSTVSSSKSLTESHSYSTSRSLSKSLSKTQTKTLSPVWPEAIGATEDVSTLRWNYYSAKGIQVLSLTGNHTVHLWPRHANGEDCEAGFYRHPQPPFNVTIVGSDAAVVGIASECERSLPCDVTIRGSFDPITPQTLIVTYENRHAPLELQIILTDEPLPPVALEMVVSRTVVCEWSPLPELYVRGIDPEGNPSGVEHGEVLLSLSDGTTIMIPLSGRLSAPWHASRMLPPGALQQTLHINATVANIGLTPTFATLVVKKCALPLVELIQGAVTAAAVFPVLLSTLEEEHELHCSLTTSNGAVVAERIPAQRIDERRVRCSFNTSTTARRVTLYAEAIALGDSIISIASASPLLEILDVAVVNHTVNEALHCVAVVLVDGVTRAPIVRGSLWQTLDSVTATASIGNLTTTQQPRNVTLQTRIEDRFDGWSVCGMSLEGSRSELGYRAEVTLEVTVSGSKLDGAAFTLSRAARFVHELDDRCLNRNASIAEPTPSLFADVRNISVSRAVSAAPWRPEAMFIDNSACALGFRNATKTYVTLTRCDPPLINTDSEVVSSLAVMLRSDAYLDVIPFSRRTVGSPRVLALAGCSQDAFPNAIGCSVRGTTPLTILGEMFNSSHNVSFSFDDNPHSVPCLSLRYVSSSQLVCALYPGFGTSGYVIIHEAADASAVISTSDRLLTYGANAAHLCPVGANGELCSGRGRCDPLTGSCRCDRSHVLGYWGGEDCGACHVRYNSSEGCLLACPLSSSNVVCSGLGFCSSGLCHCGAGWSQSTCPTSCPGYGSACSGHGVCDAARGTCACFNNSDAGYFTGVACRDCVDGYSGPNCTVVCPLGSNGLTCAGRGACYDGSCFCEAAYCGLTCELVKGVDRCDSCGAPGLYGARCDKLCPGGSASDPCSGHGVCSDGVLGTGKCLCTEGFGLADCSSPCPRSPNGTICGGRGTCAAVSAQCDCVRRTAGMYCNIDCPVANGLVCSGNGQCDEGNLGSGRCLCKPGYGGEYCNVTCGDSDTPCNGRGRCSKDGTCVCFDTADLGHWNGTNCDVCATLWAGPDCSGQCPTAAAGAVCSGHGLCENTLVCRCFSDPQRGYWRGTACDECALGYFGGDCTGECPGGACAPCSYHGTCSQGLAGSGTCTCYRDANHTLTQGLWDGDDCSQCVVTYYGPRCDRQCPRLPDGTVCANGVCNEGSTGDGRCICHQGFATDASGHCLECAKGYFGPTCAFCPSGSEQACSGHGSCDDGIRGLGLCRCDVGFAGANCSYSCPVALGRTCGYGACISQDKCACAAGYALVNQTCTTCLEGLYGPSCNLVCPACAFGRCSIDGVCDCFRGYWGALCDKQCPGGAANACSGHGTCDQATGACTCYASLALGYYEGVLCDTCVASYDSPQCNVPCPRLDGMICNNRGTCYNGTCECTILANETELITLRCGDACQLIDSSCIVNPCPEGYCGPTCMNLCPAATAASPSSACNRRGLCTVAGDCVCKSRYYGNDCSGACAVSALGLCSLRGVCRNGTCACKRGSFGPACENECPGGFNTPCSNKGTCSFGGVCTCKTGYFGAACESECPGGTTLPCNLNGVCTTTGICKCYSDPVRGYYGGAACERCAPEVSGPRCLTPCPTTRGAVVGRLCVCRDGFVGPDCSSQCPSDGEGLVCGGHGACVLSSPTSSTSSAAVCRCHEGYFGALCSARCTIAMCQATGLVRPQCNATTGTCECRDGSTGHWTGSKCDKCVGGYWGDECSLICPCNGNGFCDRFSGKCRCFQDDVNGHWSGSDCSTCSTGYVGESCSSVNVQLASAGPTLSEAKRSQTVAVKMLSVMDAVSNILYVQDANAPQSLRLTSILKNGSSLAVGSAALGGTPTSLWVLNATHIRASLVTGSVALITRGRVPPVVLTTTAAQRSFHTAVTSRVVAEYTVGGAVSCTLTLLADMSDVQVHCDDGRAATSLGSLASAMTTVTWAGVSADGATLFLIGPSLDGTNFVWAAWTIARRRAQFDAITTNSVASSGGAPVSCVAAANSTFICLLFSAKRRSTLTVAIDAASLSDRPIGFALGSPSALPVLATAMKCSVEVDVCVAAYNAVSRDSTILIFRLAALNVIGVSAAARNFVVTAAEIDERNRVVVFVMESTYAVQYQTVNLFGVQSVVPPVVDIHGGAVVTVAGIGFPTDGSSLWCDASGTVLPATVVSSTRLTCTTIGAQSADGICAKDLLNIVLGDGFSGRATSTSIVGFFRPVPATLVTAVTADGYDGYGSSDIATLVTVSGFGFVQTPYARCRLTEVGSRMEVFTTSNVTFINSTTVVCEQPISPASSAATAFEYSHDGAYYGGATRAPYTVVGPTAGLSLDADNVVVVAGAISPLPTIRIFTTDRYGNRRMKLETLPYTIRCSSLEPTVQIAGNPEAMTFYEQSALLSGLSEGMATFGDVRVVKPLAGEHVMFFFSPIDLRLSINVTLTVIAGDPAEIRITPHSTWLAGVKGALKLEPPPKIWLVDAAGNFARGNETVARVRFSAASVSPSGSIELSMGTQYATMGSGDGTFVFPAVQMRTPFDVTGTMEFAVGELPHLTVAVAQETCVFGTEYAITKTFECASCPPHGICDGTSNVHVTAGYWRSTLESFTFYECLPSDACVGGSQCTEGYEGVRCGACVSGFGRTGLACSSCYSAATSWVVISVVVLLFLALVFYLSIYSMPVTCTTDAELYTLQRKEKNPFAIVVKITISHFQMLSMIPYSTLVMPTWMRSFFAGAGAGSKLNPNLSFVGCVLAGDQIAMLKVVLLLVPLGGVTFAAVSYASAWLLTFRAKNIRKFRAELYQSAMPIGRAMDAENRRQMAEHISYNREHYDAIVKSHAELLKGEVESGESDSGNESDDERLTAQQKADQHERLVNMACVSILVTLFFLYPTLIDTCASMLVCQSIDYGQDRASGLVLQSDPSIDCNSAEYSKAQSAAWGGMIGFGLGVPLLNVLLMRLVRRTTCHGNEERARTIFFFSTGGYRHSMWFWESISLFRKMLLVLSVSVVGEAPTRVLVALWVLIASVLLNVISRPWNERMLSITEVTSLSAIAVTFGLCELLYFSAIASSDVYVTIVYVLIAAVNVVAMVTVASSLLWSVRRTIALLSLNKGAIGYFFRQLHHALDDSLLSNEALSQEVNRRKALVAKTHERSMTMAKSELLALETIFECEQRLGNVQQQGRSPSGGAPLSLARASELRKAADRLPAPNRFAAALEETLSVAAKTVVLGERRRSMTAGSMSAQSQTFNPLARRSFQQSVNSFVREVNVSEVGFVDLDRMSSSERYPLPQSALAAATPGTDSTATTSSRIDTNALRFMTASESESVDEVTRPHDDVESDRIQFRAHSFTKVSSFTAQHSSAKAVRRKSREASALGASSVLGGLGHRAFSFSFKGAQSRRLPSESMELLLLRLRTSLASFQRIQCYTAMRLREVREEEESYAFGLMEELFAAEKELLTSIANVHKASDHLVRGQRGSEAKAYSSADGDFVSIMAV